jgi:uncharacterized membrane protein YdcZ (DUF606 family)
MPVVVDGYSLATVAVQGTFYDVGSGGFATGSVSFVMTDFLWSVPTLITGLTGPIGASLNAQGAFSVNLLAMDNSGISQQWFWQFSGTIAGVVFPTRKLKIYSSLGATQNIAVLLDMGQLT